LQNWVISKDLSAGSIAMVLSRHLKPAEAGQTALAAIVRASGRAGVRFDFLVKTAQRESNLDASAKSARSSAAGLFQFTEQTWLRMIKETGDAHGMANEARSIEVSRDGRFRVADPEQRQAILDLRFNPDAASAMAAELTKANARSLQESLNRPATEGELYAAHFLGANGAARLIKAVRQSPIGQAAAIFPEAARANPNVFFASGRAVTTGELHARLISTNRASPAAAGRNVPEAQIAARAYVAQRERTVASGIAVGPVVSRRESSAPIDLQRPQELRPLRSPTMRSLAGSLGRLSSAKTA